MGEKKWWLSKTVWAGIITVALGVLKLVDQQFGLTLAEGPIVNAVIAVLGALGIYGRVSADTEIR